MRFVTMDDEGRDLMEAGMEMAHAALEARARRIDPDGIISKSVGMSRIKCEGILRGLRQPPLAAWPEVPSEDRIGILKLAAIMAGSDDENELAAAFEALRAFLLKRRSEPENYGSAKVADTAPPGEQGSPRRRKKTSSSPPEM